MEGIGARLQEIARYKKWTSITLDEELGKSRGFVAQVKRQNGNIGSDVILQIMRKFPEINLEWVLTGDGEMLKGQKENTEETKTESDQVLEERLEYLKPIYIPNTDEIEAPLTIDRLIQQRIEAITKPLEEKVNTLIRLSQGENA